MRLLVTGCARSGTGWLAACLTAAGVDCGHEAVYGLSGPLDGGWRAEASWLAAPHRPPAGTHVVHLVRHPLQVIRSNAERGLFGPPEPNAWGEYAIRHAPAIAGGSTRLARAAVYWTAWNRLVNGDEMVRVEDVTAATVTRLARVVDRTAPGVARLPERVNRQEAGLVGPPPTWETVAGIPGLVDLAARYGYRG